MCEIPWFLSGERKTFEGIASPELGILWKYFSNIRYFYIFYRNVFLLQNFEAMFLWNEKAIQIVAGPCSVESEEQLFATARGLKKIGIQTLRGGIWKPRSRAHHFEGVGESGLRWLQRVLQELSMQVAIPGLPLFCGSMHPDLFFVRDVDVNYAGVVKGRKEEFVRLGLTEKTHYLASTGIQGQIADSRSLVLLDAYAVDGLQAEQIRFLHAPEYLNPTYEYGVTFERGTAVTYGDRKQVFISGTASIDNRGEIVYPGDIVKQTERMMENISVLLKEADATTRDITQAISYLRDMADYAVVKKYFEAHYPDLPHLIVLAPVCRPGWLIETECIAVVPTESSFKPL